MGPSLDFDDFVILCAALKASSDCSTCRKGKSDGALETLWLKLYADVLDGTYGRLEISLSRELSMVLSKKNENFLFFFILDFCFHDASLKAYLALYVCAMDMVDSALKTLGLVLLKYDKIVATDFEKNVPRRLP